MYKPDPKTSLLEHSEAKIKLYGKYLAVYLIILHRASFVKKVFIFDLFCGEGIYENGAKGSPIIALETIKDHYFANGKQITDITIWFNDNGMSEIEPEKLKIDRVAEASSTIFCPANLEVKYHKEDYKLIYPKAIQAVQSRKDAKGFFFIDPFGYKPIKPDDIKKMLAGGQNEVLLWLPIAQMYRFAESVTNSNFAGSEPLRDFLTELFGENAPKFTSVYDFIEQLKRTFREYMKGSVVYVDTFTLERDATNIYCLFFFTSNIRGYEKMVETKWKVDEARGQGFISEKTLSFLNEVEVSGYKEKLLSFLDSQAYRTNTDLYQFGLENGFLPKHTNEVLKKETNIIERIPLDGEPNKGNYIEYRSKRRMGFRIKKIKPL